MMVVEGGAAVGRDAASGAVVGWWYSGFIREYFLPSALLGGRVLQSTAVF